MLTVIATESMIATNRPRQYALALSAVLCTTALACAPDTADLTEDERLRAAAVGEEAAAALVQGLGSRLGQAIQAGGPAHAVDFCSAEALNLTDSISRSLGTALQLRRTTFRVRNPANSPDDLEKEALRYFESRLNTGQPIPSEFLQRVSGREVRYYKPLYVAQPCLQCHGSPDQITPEVAELLGERYPADSAKGYSSGDFRGLIRVSMPLEAAAERNR